MSYLILPLNAPLFSLSHTFLFYTVLATVAIHSPIPLSRSNSLPIPYTYAHTYNRP